MNHKSLDNLTPRSFTSLGPTKVTRVPVIVHKDIMTILSELDRLHSQDENKMHRVLDKLIESLGEIE